MNTPKERPILFSATMVRAILDGRKTQTRRIIKLPKNCHWYHAAHPSNDGHFLKEGKEGYWHVEELPCPYGKPGDRLWVRESWGVSSSYDGVPPRNISGAAVRYPADGTYSGIKFRPSIHMPRWASRITLEITAVRNERLQDISEQDAKAEGAPSELHMLDSVRLGAKATHRAGFERLWKSINGPDSWAANPLVWMIAFRRIEQ
jgi:hypothetical protein